MNLPSSSALAAVIASDAGLHEKALACQQLAITGGPDAVPALAALLGHEKLSDYARSGLEIIADSSAGEALKKALPALKGPQLAGAIDSLGVRRETSAVVDLESLVRDPSRGAAAEALAALGKIANEASLATIRTALTGSPAELRIPAAHGALAAAQILIREGKRETAKPLLESVRSAPLPAHLIAAATSMLGAKSVQLFDGKSFEGWEGDLSYFRIVDGAIVAGSLQKDLPQNEFLRFTREFGDFTLRLKVRLVAEKGNGGIQFRSKRVPNNREMEGYQADVAADYWGALYDESRRRDFLGKRPDPAAVAKVLKPDAWNDYVIQCKGPRIVLTLNGLVTVDYTETDPAIPRTGNIAVQIHSGPPSEVWYKDIELTEG
jgi:hypothetical protein